VTSLARSGIILNMSSQPVDINGLSPEEQLRLIERLWESLSRNPERIPMTEAQRAELDRRIAEADADGGAGMPWDEVQRRIRERRG
jgi:putative addiction module component (TIGR02574 family)